MRRHVRRAILCAQKPPFAETLFEEGTNAMTSQGDAAVAGARPRGEGSGEAALARLGLRFTSWAEHWFPDAYVFVCLAVAVVAAAAMLNGATPGAVARSFGDGFWSLIIFTMQMAIVAIGGYVVASSPPAAGLIHNPPGAPPPR